jgi:hypothetical protein
LDLSSLDNQEEEQQQQQVIQSQEALQEVDALPPLELHVLKLEPPVMLAMGLPTTPPPECSMEP